MILPRGSVRPLTCLPDRLLSAAVQLSSAISAGEFDGLAEDRLADLRGLSLFLAEAEEGARDLVACLRGADSGR
jgi:hypothetical protein